MGDNTSTNHTNNDDEMNRNTYKAVMDFSGKFGVPLSLGLTMFSTQLVLANGVFAAFASGVLTIVFVFVIVKMFFSH